MAITSFFGSAFFNGEFFNTLAEVPAAAVGGGGVTYRYFTPIPPPLRGKKKKTVDRLVEQEARLLSALKKYEDTGADIAVLEEISRKLNELRIQLLRMALESILVQQYIEWKRKQEDEDIAFILSQIV